MGLKIAQFKKNGIVFPDAYAKILNVSYNNSSKIATFSIGVYPAKDDSNIIHKFTNYYAKIEPVDNVTVKCYNRISTIVANVNAQIAEREARKLEIANDENKVLAVDAQIAQLKASEILQLDGAVEW